MISVIMPVYNGEKYLREAIDSILNQTYSDFEFIIINDCSTDSTEEVIKSYSDNRIVYIKNEVNMGVANTLNRGLDIARGEYIARMDADDISLPQRFEKQIKHINEHKNSGVCGTGIEFIGEKSGNILFDVNPEENKVNLIFNSCMAHPTVMFKRDCIKNFRYNSNFEGLEDYELWYRISQEYGITNVPEILLKYRIHPNQATQNYSEQFVTFNNVLKQQIIEDMGVEYDNDELKAFQDFSINKINYDKQLLSLVRLFNKFYKVNNMNNKYCKKFLKLNFKSIIISKICNQDKKNRYSLIKESDLITVADVIVNMLKRKIKSAIFR